MNWDWILFIWITQLFSISLLRLRQLIWRARFIPNSIIKVVFNVLHESVIVWKPRLESDNSNGTSESRHFKWDKWNQCCKTLLRLYDISTEIFERWFVNLQSSSDISKVITLSKICNVFATFQRRHFKCDLKNDNWKVLMILLRRHFKRRRPFKSL